MPELDAFEKRVLRSGGWRILTQKAILPWVLRVSNLPGEARVLEVGSGGGFNAEVFLERFPGWWMTASDYDPAMVDLARRRVERFGDRVQVERADATALTFSDETFDLVIAIFVWHHVGDWRAATAEAARVLKPGGALVLADLTEGFFPAPIAKLFPPATRYRSADVPAAFAGAGFARWKIRPVGPFMYRALARK